MTRPSANTMTYRDGLRPVQICMLEVSVAYRILTGSYNRIAGQLLFRNISCTRDKRYARTSSRVCSVLCRAVTVCASILSLPVMQFLRRNWEASVVFVLVVGSFASSTFVTGK